MNGRRPLTACLSFFLFSYERATPSHLPHLPTVSFPVAEANDNAAPEWHVQHTMMTEISAARSSQCRKVFRLLSSVLAIDLFLILGEQSGAPSG